MQRDMFCSVLFCSVLFCSEITVSFLNYNIEISRHILYVAA